MARRRQFLSGVSVFAALVFALGGCRQEQVESEPDPLDGTDPRILRGVWTGENEEGETLRLALKAGPPYNGGYRVEGVFDLNKNDYIEFTGSVAVPVTQSSPPLSAQVSPTCGPFNAFAEVDAWGLCGTVPDGSPPQFDVSLSSDRGDHSFTVTKMPDTTELPEDEDAPIVTDAVRYTPQVSADAVTYTVEATYTNNTNATVYLSPCGYEPPVFGLERLEGGSWNHRTVIGGLCPGVGGVPDTELKPGESFTTTLDISASIPSPATPLFGVDLLPGVHRLRFVVANTESNGDADVVEGDELLPLEQRVSNAFELRAP